MNVCVKIGLQIYKKKINNVILFFMPDSNELISDQNATIGGF